MKFIPVVEKSDSLKPASLLLFSNTLSRLLPINKPVLKLSAKLRVFVVKSNSWGTTSNLSDSSLYLRIFLLSK